VGTFGLALVGAGLYLGLSETAGQAALASFEAELHAAPENRGAAVVHLESRLDDVARHERRMNHVLTGYMGAFALVLAGVTTAEAVESRAGREPVKLVGGYGGALVAGAIAWRISQMEMPTERLLRLYRSDPGLQLGVGAAPLSGGAALSFSGRF
jgi:hypothetical protein